MKWHLLSSRFSTLLAAVGTAVFLIAGCSAPSGGHARNDARVTKPPNTLLSTVLAHGRIMGNEWELTYFEDDVDGSCIAVTYDSAKGIPACNFEVDDRHPIDAAMQRLNPQVVVTYGAVTDATSLVNVRKGSAVTMVRTLVPPRHANRFFVVFAINKDVDDVYVNTAKGRFSLRSKLTQFDIPDT